MKLILSTALLLASARAFMIPHASHVRGSSLQVFDRLFSTSTNSQYPVIADESVMSKKAHGTSEKPVQKDLRWKCDYDTADRSKLCRMGSFYYVVKTLLTHCTPHHQPINWIFSLQLQSSLRWVCWLLDNHWIPQFLQRSCSGWRIAHQILWFSYRRASFYSSC